MFPIDPYRMFESQPDGVMEPQYASALIAAAGNATIVAAVTGKRIKVIGAVLQSYNGTPGTPGNIQFRTNTSGGTIVFYAWPPDGSIANPLVLEPNAVGYFETSTGEALVGVAATADQAVNIQYITYTP